ncbi:restriction endonuclease subunit S [Francisellaceae bacterium CB52]
MVKAGYKQTDIGVIPEDWEVKKLGDIGNPSMCKRIMKYQTSDMGQVPFYKIGTFGKKADSYITFELYNEFKNKFSYPKKGDVLISASGTIGRIVVFDGTPSYFQDSNIVWIDNNEKVVVNEYLTYIYQVTKWSTEDTTIARLYNDNLKAILIPIPPKQEQKAIAKALSDTDELISSLEKLIAKKQAIKQGTMQQLLTGKKRLSGFSGVWEEKRLGDVFNVTAGQSKSKFIDAGDNYIVDMGSVSTEGKLIVSKKTSLNEDFLSIGDLVMPKDDIGGGNIIGKVAHINLDKKYILGDHVFKLKVKKDDSLFLSYFINSYHINQDFRKKASGSAQIGLSKPSVENQLLKIPSEIKEQQAIAKILSDMDNELESLKAKLAKIKAIKDGMMSELLTGKTRLEVKDE